MMRKAISLACCLSLALTSPGAQSVFAQIVAVSAGERVQRFGDKPVVISNGYTFEKAHWLDLNALRNTIRQPGFSSDARSKVSEIATRLQFFADDPRFRNPEAERSVQNFLLKSKQPGANKDMLLMELFDGLEPYLSRAEELGNYTTPIYDNGESRAVRVYNGLQDREVEEEHTKKINESVQKFEIYKPDLAYNPKHPTKDHPAPRYLDAMGFIYERDGAQVQRVFYSRRLEQVAKIMRRAFYQKPETEAKIKMLREQSKDAENPIWWTLYHIYDPKDQLKKKQDADSLAEELKKTREDPNGYKGSGIDKVLSDLAAQNLDTVRPEDLTPDVIDKKFHELENRQYTVQKFYSKMQLENLQKMMLAFLVQYFTQKLGLNYDPFNQKSGSKEGFGISNMPIEDVQKLLEDFENGTYGGYSFFGRWLKSQKLDPDRDMEPSLKALGDQAIRFMGYAVDARARMASADAHQRREERMAALDEAGRWISLAQVHLQQFQLTESAAFLQRLKDGTNAAEMQLYSEDRKEAENLIREARGGFTSRYEDLERRTMDVQARQLIASFALGLHNARYAYASEGSLEEKVAVLSANVKEMRALYLSMRFKKFIAGLSQNQLDQFRGKYRNEVQQKAKDGSASAYYLDEVRGGLYVYFQRHLDGQTARGFAQINSVIGMLQQVPKNDGAAARRALSPVERAAPALYAIFGIEEAPTADAVEKDSAQLGVFQTYLGRGVGEFESRLKMFVGVNQLYLSLQKYTTSTDDPEVRSKSWFTNFVNLDKAKHWINFFGLRDKAFDGAANLLDSDDYDKLKSPKAQTNLKTVRELMRSGNYAQAKSILTGMDIKGAADAKTDYRLTQMRDLEDKSLDLNNMLTQDVNNEGEAAVQGALGSLGEGLPRLMRRGMIGTSLFDLGVMSAIGPALGWAASGLLAQAGGVFTKIEEVLDGVQTLRAVQALDSVGLGYVIRYAAKALNLPVKLLAKALPKMAENLKNTYGLKDLREVGSRFGLYTDLAGRAFKYQLKMGLNIARASAVIESMRYAWSPRTSSYNSIWDVISMSVESGFSFGALGAPLFALMLPASAVQGEGLFSRAFRGYGRGTPFAGGIRNLVARPLARWFNVNGARRIVEHPNGLWGLAGERMFRVASPTLRFFANAGVQIAAHLDGYAKFLLHIGMISEAAQAVSYWRNMRDGVPTVEGGEKDPNYLPSNGLQSLVAAHKTAQAAANVGFMTLPGGDVYSPEDMVRFRDSKAATLAVLDAGGEDMSRIFTIPSDRMEKIDVPIRWQHMLRRAVSLGPEKAQFSISPEAQKTVAKEILRKMSPVDWFVVSAMPEEERNDLDQIVRTNGQKFFSQVELRRIFRGEKLDPAAEWNENRSKAPPSMRDHIFESPEFKDAADELIREKLLTDHALAARIKNANRTGSLIIDKVETKNPEMIRQIQERFAGTFWDAKKSKDVQAVLRKMSDVFRDADKKRLDPENFKDVFKADGKWNKLIEREWTRLAKQIAKKGEKGANIAWVMERDEQGKPVLTEQSKSILTDLLFKHLMDYAIRQGGKLSPEQALNTRKAIVESVENILKNGGVKNPRDRSDIKDFKYFDKSKNDSPQKKAFEEFVDNVLAGRDLKAAQKTAAGVLDSLVQKAADEQGLTGDARAKFVFLEASGGKTLLIKVGFIPYLKARAERSPLAQFFQGKPRKIWYVTSNGHLARQFRADWTAYSGGIPPDFRVSGVDEWGFEEVWRKERNERSIGAEYNFIFDEGDHPYTMPQRTVGKPNGKFGAYNGDHPMVQFGLDLREWAKKETASLKDQGMAPEHIQAVLETKVAKQAHETASAWREKQKEIAGDSNVSKLNKEQMVENGKAIQQMFGRMSPRRGFSMQSVVQGVAERFKEKGIAGGVKENTKAFGDWIQDDGVEAYLNYELTNYVKFYTLKDSSQVMKKDGNRPTPLFGANAVPTLSTEYRTAAELEMIQDALDKGQETGLKELQDLKWSLPLKSTHPTTQMETVERTYKAGSEQIDASGTAANKVRQALRERIGAAMINQGAGETNLPENRRFLVVDDHGFVNVVDINKANPAGVVSERDLTEVLPKIETNLPHDVQEYNDQQKIRLAVQMVREFKAEASRTGKKPLLILMPRSVNELKVLEQAILDAKLTQSDKIVRFFPDYVHQRTKGLDMEKTDRLVNDGALNDGSAEIVLLVPEIGGRGTDMNFSKYNGKVMVMGFDTHQVPTVEYIQALARTGRGRIADQSRITYVDISTTKGLLSDLSLAKDLNLPDQNRDSFMEKNPGYMPTLRWMVNDIANGKFPDIDNPKSIDGQAAARLRDLLPKDPKRPDQLDQEKMKELLAGLDNQEFKDFAARGDVYAAMHPLLQENAQNAALRPSGVLTREAPETLGHKAMSATAGAAGLAAMPFYLLGHPVLAMMSGIPSMLMKMSDKKKTTDRSVARSASGKPPAPLTVVPGNPVPNGHGPAFPTHPSAPPSKWVN